MTMEPWLETFARANFQRSADTAHDLKTPLNVAVLNLELLRMRLRRLTEEEDEKIVGYAQAIEAELRRMGRIFDAFFLLSTPPQPEEAPVLFDFAAVAAEVAEHASVPLTVSETLTVRAHEVRIRQALKLFFEGATKLFAADGRSASLQREADQCILAVSGTTGRAEHELSKIFKFYHTDSDGNPDISLAVTRLIAETYGGELNALDERDNVTLRLAFPLGD